MLIRRPDDIPSSEITPEETYLNRRSFIEKAGAIAAAAAVPMALPRALRAIAPEITQDKGDKLTDYKSITTYNNYYEFGTDKGDPSANAGEFRTSPWSVKVDGLVKSPKTWALEDLLRGIPVQEHVYRMRCVEAWSMVIPWQGVQLRDIIARCDPLPSAKYVEMTTLLDPQQMPGQRRRILNWPYREGLRMDEAMHPLTLLATGIYNKDLLNQNGAPLRLVVPWKYGFKGVKAIVRLRFTEKMPLTTWAEWAPDEYGFYANVNPAVNHPRWSQARERRVGEFFRIDTKMFNGYADQVASMYAGMDLRKNF